MRIAELYKSNQGEGRLTGTESVFVRTSGCNLRCWFCDTPFTSWTPEGDDFDVDSILDQVSTYACRHVVITGGEPMLHAELLPLCAKLKEQGHHITIETAGTLYLPVACDLMSISPKMSNSTPSLEQSGAWHARHERARLKPDVLQRLVSEYPHQVKFVIDSPTDCEEMLRFLDGFRQVTLDNIWLMPQGTDLETLTRIESWLQPWCTQHGVHYCPRKHIEWYGFSRGT